MPSTLTYQSRVASMSGDWMRKCSRWVSGMGCPPRPFCHAAGGGRQCKGEGVERPPGHGIVGALVPPGASPVSEDLLYEIRDGIGRITFNRPEARNALTFAMYDRLAEISHEAGQDSRIQALILTGTGDKAFAAGTDITQFRAFGSPGDAISYEARLDRVLEALERCTKPTIAAIAGACTGGGAAIASA